MQKTAIGFRLDHRCRSSATLQVVSEQTTGVQSARFAAQMMRVMRMLTLLLFAASMAVSARPSAQTITLTGKGMELEAVFSVIKKQTGFLVAYNAKLIQNTSPVSIQVSDMPLSDFLSLIFRDQPLTYRLLTEAKTVLLSEKPVDGRDAGNDRSDKLDALAPFLNIWGQLISSKTNEPIVAASISVKHGKVGTSSGNNGRFVLSNIPDNAIIVITSIGYSPVEVALSKLTAMTGATPLKLGGATILKMGAEYLFEMEISDKMIDQVQITAYGKTTKRFSTGSIGTVKGEEIERQPVMNVLQALEGKVPGLTISPISGNSAAPVRVEIRGRNSLNANALSEPLYVVDGMPQATLQVGMFYGQDLGTGTVQAGRTNTAGESPLFYLNPRDIESIDVLKDGDATAIYGARGANGVILITTKRSKPGPTQLTMDVQRGSVTIPKKLDLLNTQEYLAVRKEAFRNDGITPTIYNAPDLTLWDQTKYTDWQKYFYKPGVQTSFDAYVSGGNVQTNYRIGASYQSQDELNNNGGKNHRGTFTGNVTHSSPDQKLQIEFASQLSITNVVAIQQGDNPLLIAPNAPDIYNEFGDFNFEPYRGQSASLFPFGFLKRRSDSRTNTINNRLNVRYELIKGLNISVAGSYSFSGNENAAYDPLAAYDPYYIPMSAAIFGKANSISWSVDPKLAYNTFVGKGNLSVQLGGSLQNFINEGVTVIATSFSDDNLMRSPNNAASVVSTEAFGQYKFNGAFGIINYRWDNKYVVNLSGRRDGSSRFGPGKRFGNFGSIGLAWIATEENWMKNALPRWWSFLKLAGSYGITGTDGVGDYEYLTRWGTSIALNNGAKLLDYNGMPTMHSLAHTNPDFRWEATNKLNASISIGLFDDKINIEGTYYQARAGNQLVLMGTPVYTGFSSVRANRDAVVQNSGVEFSLSARILNSKDWNISGGFNIGMNRNKLIEFPGLAYSSYASRYEVGKSMNFVYLLKYTGINAITGDYTFEDHNKDGVINAPSSMLKTSPQDDRYILYDLNDRFGGGFNFNIAYRSFAVFTGFVFKKAWAKDPFISLRVGAQNNLYLPQEVKDNHWRQPGDIAKYPKYTTGNLDYRITVSDAAYQDASYLQMNNLALSYDLPKWFINKIKMKNCRLSVSTQNVFIITSFKGIDPKINAMMRGNPTPRIISSSLSFTF